MVSFDFGLPSAELLTQVRAYPKVISSATTIEEARWLEGHGVDAIIAQGLKVGGHRGMFLSNDLTTQVGTFALLPQVVQAVKLPLYCCRRHQGTGGGGRTNFNSRLSGESTLNSLYGVSSHSMTVSWKVKGYADMRAAPLCYPSGHLMLF
jgi:hypothetical protein